MNKLRKGDEVIVIAGRDKGKRGTVLRTQADGRLIVEGINIIKKHVRPNPGRNETGGIIEKEAPIQYSNVAIYNHVTKQADRVGFRFLKDGRKVRYFKSDDEVVDVG